MHTGVKSFGCENRIAPAVAEVVVEVDGALGRLGGEVGGIVAKSYSHRVASFVVVVGDFEVPTASDKCQ